MAGEVLNPLLAFAAGALTILSPCVLPLVPVVLASAGQRHRHGPFALAGGLIASFTIVGFVLAVFGTRLGVDAEQLRSSGALILAAAGLFLLVTKIQDFVAAVAENRPARSTGDLGRQVVQVVYSAYLAAANGARVEIPV